MVIPEPVAKKLFWASVCKVAWKEADGRLGKPLHGLGTWYLGLKPPAFFPKRPLYNVDRLADVDEEIERERGKGGREGKREINE